MIFEKKLYILVYHDSKRFLGYSEFASRYRFKAVTFNGDFRESFFETGRQAFESRRKISDFFIADLTWKLIKVTRKFTTKLNLSKFIYDILKYIFKSFLWKSLSSKYVWDRFKKVFKLMNFKYFRELLDNLRFSKINVCLIFFYS